MYHPFSIVETLQTAWKIFKNNFVTIIVYSAISFFLLSVLAVITQFIILPEEFAGRMIVSFFLIFVQAYTTLGLYKLIFTVIDSEYYEFEISQVLPGIKMIISYLIVVFLIAFLITTFHFFTQGLNSYPNIETTVEVLGTFLGLFLALRIMFFNNFIVDDHSGAFESLRQSWDLTRGYFFKVLSILIIILLFIALPALISQYYPFVSLAIVFTYPFVNIVLAVTYRKLIYSHQDVDDDIAETN